MARETKTPKTAVRQDRTGRGGGKGLQKAQNGLHDHFEPFDDSYSKDLKERLAIVTRMSSRSIRRKPPDAAELKGGLWRQSLAG